MTPNPRVVQAFRSMKEIGISDEKVKPVLKKLLKLYDRNWELIESENYRILADAIFEEEDSKQEESFDEEGSMTDELLRPLKRTRLKTQEGLASSSHPIDSSNVAETILKELKVEDELIPRSLQQKSLESNVVNMRTEIQPASPQLQPPSPVPVLSDHSGRDKGKQKVQTRPNYKGKEPMSPHVASKGTGPENVSVALRIKDPAPEPIEIAGASASASVSERHTSCELATDPDEIPSELEIASSPLGEMQISEGNEMLALDALKKSPARDACDVENVEGNGCVVARLLNGSFNNHCSANGFVGNAEGEELVVSPQRHLTPKELRCLHDASDITKGEENVEISWMKDVVLHVSEIVSCPRSLVRVLVKLGEILLIPRQVFLTPDGRGWGLRTLEKLPKGSFVCEFVGEILTISELYARNREKHTSPVLLDAYWGLKGVPKDEEALCLDATCYGNVARFINHRCLDANLIEIPVEVETPDLHYYHFAFFTTRDVNPLEELTWDYGIDFDDLDHPVKTFQCRCGSKFCRNMKRSTRSKFATR
ncbi:Histone-lysine N-methyltransferase SUVR4 [Hibiscus syriacus]|uniref:Histone-lysine N-methyltransferase SUVR4 n=1 Tax=Hibiscus syriacus TaxID=106335 RepID=A0A6A2YJU4_HIBSY|nr:Histone-lysine N-methyltransferase SUVR4 [Hibiscus syriacus]